LTAFNGWTTILTGWSAISVGLSFSVAALAIYVLRPAATRLDLLDHPRGRKDHQAPTPVTGGLGIMAGVLAVSATGAGAPLGLICACAVILVGGTIDDRFEMPWYGRMATQAIAILAMIYLGGARIDQVGRLLGDNNVGLGALTVPFTLVAGLGVINAINMFDGVDGLAASVALCGLCMIVSIALTGGDRTLATALWPFIGGLAGFLALNLRNPWKTRASVFLGNAGSDLVGLVICWAGCRLTQNSGHPVSPGLAPWLLAPPLIDCIGVMFRRLASRRSPFKAGRDHLHHRLLDSGFSATEVVLIAAAATLIIGMGASMVARTGLPDGGLDLLFLLVLLAYTAKSIRPQVSISAGLAALFGKPGPSVAGRRI
jgi:UDP-GlcNAc:undecaprenyl-phosphate GlcNAc-1-phosphate transferase